MGLPASHQPNILHAFACTASFKRVAAFGHQVRFLLTTGLNNRYNESRSNPKLYAVDYNELFVDTIYKALQSVDPTIAWVDSSPSKGLISKDPYVKSWEEAYLTDRGDVHFYDTDDKNDPWSTTLYPRAKFVSEFGFQSFPSFSSYQKQSATSDWSYNSSATAFRLVLTCTYLSLQHLTGTARQPP